MRSRVTCVMFAVFVLAGLSMNIFAGDWLAWRGPNQGGISEEKLNPAGISKRLWEVRVGKGYSAVAVKGKHVFTMGNDGSQDTIYCLDAGSGKEVWKFSYPCSKGGGYAGPRSTPVLDDKYVYTFSLEGQVHCIDAESGKKKWVKSVADFGCRNLKWSFSSSPLVTDKLVIVNAGKSGIALDKKSGKKVWGSGGIGGYATPVLFTQKKKQYVAIFGEKALYTVDYKNGKVAWSFPWETKYDVNAADPIVTEKWIFISSGYGKGCALLDICGKKPKVKWQNTNLKNHFNSSIYQDQHIYGCDGNTGSGSLVCLDPQNGSTKWREDLGFGSIVAGADGSAAYLNERGTLTVGKISSSSFQQVGSENVLKRAGKCWTVPILANSRLYCRGSNGKLVCLDVK